MKEMNEVIVVEVWQNGEEILRRFFREWKQVIKWISEYGIANGREIRIRENKYKNDK